MSDKISIYCDGSSCGNRAGPIGWAWIITDWNDVIAYGKGCESEGTNNIAELMGAIEGLEKARELGLHKTHKIELVSDSEYVLGVASSRYCVTKNLNLCDRIQKLAKEIVKEYRWVKGHSGEGLNEQCDKMAKEAKMSLMPPTPKAIKVIRKKAERKRRKELIKKI